MPVRMQLIFIVQLLITLLFTQAGLILAVPDGSDVEGLVALVQVALSAGCGFLIQLAFRQYLERLQDQQKPDPSAFKKRWIVWGLCVVVPTLLYGFLIIGGTLQYGIYQHFAYMGAAYFATQGLHSTVLSKVPTPPAPPNNVQ